MQTSAAQAGLTESRFTLGKIETTRGSQDKGVDSKLILKPSTARVSATAPANAP